MGEPQTWTVTYDIALKGTELHRKHLAYVLFGTPKKSGNVKDVTMWVNVKTYAIESVAFNYNSGATLNLELNHHGVSPYHLPTSVGVQANFPQYKGNATITYGKYTLNQPIPDSVFQD
jgi:outer membrane lipoprotein-sorting protein